MAPFPWVTDRMDYSDLQLIEFGKAISRVFGWTYFIAWSLSFYPQLLKTHQRRSVTGLSIDFFTVNVVGFTVYTTTTYLFLFSSTIRDQYALRHPTSPIPSVQLNDLAFGIHALILTIFMWCQFWFFGFKRDPSQKLSPGMTGVIVGSGATITAVSTLVYFKVGTWEALDIAYTLGYIKLLITILKYIPQAYLHYRRKSTVGWSIHNIILDTTGGSLSLAQLFLDSALAGDLWGGTFGNPLKLGLGFVTLGFDSLFLTQHYVWYREKEPSEKVPQSLIPTNAAVSEPNRRNYGTVNMV